MGNFVEFEDTLPGDLVTLSSMEVDFTVSGEIMTVGFNPLEGTHQIKMMYLPTKKMIFGRKDFEIVKHQRPLKFPETGRFLKFRVRGNPIWGVGVWDSRKFSGVSSSGVKVSIVVGFESVEWEYIEGV